MTLDSNLTIDFSERMRRESIESSFAYTNGVNTFDISDGNVSWLPDNTYPTQMIFDPFVNFQASQSYTITVTSGAVDVGGLSLNPSFTQTETTTNS